MKAIAVFTMCLCLIAMLFGCAPTGSELQAPAFSLSEVSEDTLSEDGAVIFTKSYPKFQLSFPSETATEAITKDLQQRIDLLLKDAGEIEAFAREDYAGQEDWAPYFAKIHCTVMHRDEKVLSLYLEYSGFSGSGHPTLSPQSVTYDLSNGKPLTLEDILVEDYPMGQLSIPVDAALSGFADRLYDDYEATVGNLFYSSDSEIENWYFSEEGLCFHFAPYQIAPYAEGTITATLAYAELSQILHSDFLPK